MDLMRKSYAIIARRPMIVALVFFRCVSELEPRPQPLRLFVEDEQSGFREPVEN